MRVGPSQLKPSVGQTGGSVSRDRESAARMARDLRRGTLSFAEFANQCGSSPDERIAELFELIEHEPQCGGLFGVSEETFAEYQLRIDRAICALEE